MCDNCKSIILIGFMGSGKSSVGHKLAEHRGRSFLDTDNLVEEKAGKTIASIFAEDGEASFREIETAVIRELKNRAGDNAVVATGGGVVLKKENREALRETGTVVWLNVSPREVLNRVEGSDRPLLQKKDKEKAVRELIALRKDLYAVTAHYTVDTDGKTPGRVAEDIIKLLNLKDS